MESLSWNDAKSRCASLAPGANLASVFSSREEDFIKGMNDNISL